MGLFMVIFLAGCLNDNDMAFTGESQNWSARYEVSHTIDDNHRNTLTLTYEGDDPAHVGTVKYKYAATPGEGSGETELSGRREIVHQSGGNGAIPLKDSIIEVTVEWNGHKEELKLSANKK